MALSHDLQASELSKLALRPGLRLDPLESPGQDISDEETDAIIRAILTEDQQEQLKRRRQKRVGKAFPELAPAREAAEGSAGQGGSLAGSLAGRLRKRATPVAAGPVRKPAKTPEKSAAPRKARAEAQPAPMPASTRARFSLSRFKTLKLRRNAEPRDDRQPRWLRPVAYAGFALLLLVWPLLPVLALAFAVSGFVIFVAIVGKGSFHEAFGRLYRWLKARRPDRAELMRRRMDRLAERVDGWLDRLPTTWAERLALPDFSAATLDPDDTGDLPDPFEKLTRAPS